MSSDQGGLDVNGQTEPTIQILVADDNSGVLTATGDLLQEFPGVQVVSLAPNVGEAVRSAAWRAHWFMKSWPKVTWQPPWASLSTT